MDIGNIISIGPVVLAFVVVLMAIKTVPEGMEYTVERFGKYTHTLKPGLSFIVPFIDKIGYKVNMRERMINIPSQDLITKNNLKVTADAVVFVQIIDARQAAYEVENLDNAIQNLCLINFRTIVGSMDLDEVLSCRDEINARLLTSIVAATKPWGAKVLLVEIGELFPN